MQRAITRALVLLGLLAAAPRAWATTAPSNIPNTMRDCTGSGEARDLLVRADEALNGLTYTYYSDKNVWDTLSGIYKVICSYYLNNLMDDALPEHYDAMLAMVDKTNYRRLSSWDYYDIFRTIPYNASAYGWRRIEKVADLRPGDVVVWKKATTDGTWGHVFLIASMPERDTRWSGAYKLRITDSTSDPHSNDSRCSTCTGVGAGDMLLRASSTSGRVYDVSWSLKGYWKAGSFAMARPVPM
jgi:hypothetical protein